MTSSGSSRATSHYEEESQWSPAPSATQSEPMPPGESFSLLTSPRLVQSEPGTPRRGVTVADIDACFGKFDGQRYDVSGLSPVQALGKISAIVMLTTKQVGDPSEDPTMAEARPHLAKINERGLVTLDSQMGKIEEYPRTDMGSTQTWQRSYVIGFLPIDMGRNFQRKMDLVNGVVLYVGKPGQLDIFSPRFSVPVTKCGDSVETLWGNSSIPMTTTSFRQASYDLLDEVREIVEKNDTCYKVVEEDAVNVYIVDMVWGRPFWLFEKIADVLQEVSGMSRTRDLHPWYDPSNYYSRTFV